MRKDFQNWSFLATMASPYSGETTSMPQKASTLCQALQFLASLLRLLSHIRVKCNEMLCGDLCSIILPWSGCGVRKVSPVLVSAGRDSVWCFSSPLHSPAAHLPWDDTVWHVCKTLGQLSSSFHHDHASNACHQSICLKCRQGWKGSSEPSCPSPASLYLESTGERSMQGKRAINCNVTGYHYLLCFVACSLVSKALHAKLGLPDKVLVLCFSAWPFWIVTNKWDVGLLRSSVPANQSHISPLSFPPQELRD